MNWKATALVCFFLLTFTPVLAIVLSEQERQISQCRGECAQFTLSSSSEEDQLSVECNSHDCDGDGLPDCKWDAACNLSEAKEQSLKQAAHENASQQATIRLAVSGAILLFFVGLGVSLFLKQKKAGKSKKEAVLVPFILIIFGLLLAVAMLLVIG
ncbi:MAG: hypothetical protein V1493_04195 [Candidatus Diapherotrites archaeon]